MARDENPPFERGDTWYGGDTPDATDLGGVNILGMEWIFNDQNPTTGVARTERYVRCRAVRNTSGIALLPKRLVVFSTTAGEYGFNVDGYCSTAAQEAYPTDEYLPTAGVVDDDIFWIVMEGPAVVETRTADMDHNIGVGGWGVAATADSSQAATTAGRINAAQTTGATGPLWIQIVNRIGRAMTARTTQNTNEDILIDVGHW
jgi:hypothetical protein